MHVSDHYRVFVGWAAVGVGHVVGWIGAHHVGGSATGTDALQPAGEALDLTRRGGCSGPSRQLEQCERARPRSGIEGGDRAELITGHRQDQIGPVSADDVWCESAALVIGQVEADARSGDERVLIERRLDVGGARGGDHP